MIEDLVRHISGDATTAAATAGLVVVPVDPATRPAVHDAVLEAVARRAAAAGVPLDAARQLCVLDAAEAELLVPGSGPAAPPELRAAYGALDDVVVALARWFEHGGARADLALLEERRDAVERRVSALEAGSALAPAVRDLRAIERWVLARVAAVRRAGVETDPLPLLLDDPFRPVRGTRKWQLLDLLARLASHCPVLYLTADPDVVLWARRRDAASSGLTFVGDGDVQSMRRSPSR